MFLVQQHIFTASRQLGQGVTMAMQTQLGDAHESRSSSCSHVVKWFAKVEIRLPKLRSSFRKQD